MKKSMSILALSFGALALASTSLVAVLGGSNHGLLGNHTVQKAGTAENVSTPYSLILNGDAGYNGEASKTVLSSLGNPLEIGFSDPAKFGKASKGVAFSTLEGGAYLFTSTKLSGVSEIFVKGTSSNENAGIKVYGHYYSQTRLVNDSETVEGSLNSIIRLKPTNFIAIEFLGIDTIESVEIGYECQDKADPFAHLLPGGTKPNSPFYQSYAALKTDLPVGTSVNVEMDVSVTGTYGQYSSIRTVDSLWGDGTVNEGVMLKDAIGVNQKGWHHVSFVATVREFDAFRIEKDYQMMNTSKDGKAIFLLSQNESVDAFNYKNVEIQKLDSMIPCGNNGNQADIYYQSVTGLKTDLEVGTAVEVELDVQVTGSFNEWCQIVWVDEVWSAEGGEADKKAVRIDSLFDYGNTGWQHIKFSATVRNFPVLRFNGGYAQKADTSAFGNAVYLMAMNKSENSFSYKNAKISTVPSMIPAGKNSKNAYQQSLAVLPSDLAIGTSVDVEFDALLTGTFDEWCQIYWIDKVWTAEGGEANADETRIEKLFDFANKDWQHIKFSANIREFPALRVGTDYPIYDTSKMGKGVYLLSMNPSEQSFNYKNVVITAK